MMMAIMEPDYLPPQFYDWGPTRSYRAGAFSTRVWILLEIKRLRKRNLLDDKIRFPKESIIVRFSVLGMPRIQQSSSASDAVTTYIYQALNIFPNSKSTIIIQIRRNKNGVS